MSAQRKNILCIRFSALGDVALAIPAVYDACRSNPDANFVFLTRRHPARLFINAPANLTVEGVDLNEYKGIAGLRRLARELKGRYAIDTVVDLHDVIRSHVISAFLRLGGARTARIDKGRKEKRRLTRRHNKAVIPLQAVTGRYADTFRRAGLAAEPRFSSVYGGKKAPEGDFKAVSQPKEPGWSWIAVAPFARHKGKIYPLHLMERVVAALAGRERTRVFLMGAGEEERAVLEAWAKKYPATVNVADISPGLPAEMALISHCDVMVSMDSANMHIASLAGTPVVSVWGATHPFTGFMGFGQSADNAVQLDMVCRPCSVFGDKPCMRGDYHCLEGILPQMIVDKVAALLPR